MLEDVKPGSYAWEILVKEKMVAQKEAEEKMKRANSYLYDLWCRACKDKTSEWDGPPALDVKVFCWLVIIGAPFIIGWLFSLLTRVWR